MADQIVELHALIERQRAELAVLVEANAKATELLADLVKKTTP
jgi:hypothetical protein